MKSAGTIIFEETGILIFEDKAYPNIIIQDIKINNKLKITEQTLEEGSSSYKIVDGYEDREVNLSCLIITNYNNQCVEWSVESGESGDIPNSTLHSSHSKLEQSSIDDVYTAIKKIDTIFKKGYVYDVENDFLNSIEIKKLVFTDFEINLKAGEHKATIELKFIESDSIREKMEVMVEQAKNMGVPEDKAKALTKAELEKIILKNKSTEGELDGMSVL